MVIIYPDSITSFVLTDDDVRKGLIDSDIMFPTFFLENCIFRIIGDLVMECRPKDLLAIPIIMTFEIGIGDEDRN